MFTMIMKKKLKHHKKQAKKYVTCVVVLRFFKGVFKAIPNEKAEQEKSSFTAIFTDHLDLWGTADC